MTIIQEFDNGKNIIHLPDLTEAEKKARQKRIEKASQMIAREILRKESNK